MSSPICPIRLSELLDNQGGALCAYAAKWANWPEDCVQEAFLALAAEIPSPANPKAWLYLVTKRKAINQSRENQRRSEREQISGLQKPLVSPSPALEIGLTEEKSKLNKLVDQLPDPLREIVILRNWGELTWAEIEKQTNIPPTTLQRHYKSALLQLKKNMETTCQTPTNHSTGKTLTKKNWNKN